MASFSDYYAAELAKRGISSGMPLQREQAPRKPSGIVIPENLRTPAKEPETNPLLSAGGWVLDILDRPRRAIANPLNEALDYSPEIREKAEGGDFAGALGAAAQGILNWPAAAVKGMFSTDNDDQAMSAEIIEKAADSVGPSLDPEYVDEENNISGGTKAVAGFALDMVSDPTIYIPGAVLLKGAKTGAKAADFLLSNASKALVGQKGLTWAEHGARAESKAAEGVTAAAKAAEDAPDVAKALDADDLGLVGSKPFAADQAPAPTARAAENPFEGSVPAPAAKPVQATDALLRVLSETPSLTQSASKALVHVPRSLGSEAAEALSRRAPAATQPSVAHVADEAGSIPLGGSSVEKLVAASPARQPMQELLGSLTPSRSVSEVPQDAAAWLNALPGDHVIKAASGAFPVSRLKADFGQMKQIEKQLVARGVDPKTNANWVALNRKVGGMMQSAGQAHQRALKAGAPAINKASVFMQKMAYDQKAVEDALGWELTDFLKSKVILPRKFDETVASISKVLDAGPETAETLRVIDRNLSNRLSDRLGVPRIQRVQEPEAVAAAVQKLQLADDTVSVGVKQAVDAVLAYKKIDLPFEITKGGEIVGRSTLAPGKGVGVYRNQLNSFDQYSLYSKTRETREAMSKTVDVAKGARSSGYSEKFGVRRTMDYMAAELEISEKIAKALDTLGVQLRIGLGDETVALSSNEVYRGILDAAEAAGKHSVAAEAMFNYGTAVPHTLLTLAQAKAVLGGSRDEVLAILTRTKKTGAKGEVLDESLGNNLVRWTSGQTPNHGVWAFPNRKQAAAYLRELGLEADAKNIIRRGEKGRTSKTSGNVRNADVFYVPREIGGVNVRAEALADLVMDAAPALKLRAAENEAARIARVGEEAHKLATDGVKAAEAVLSSGAGTISIGKELVHVPRSVVESAAPIAATAEAVDIASGLVRASVGEDVLSAAAAISRPTKDAGALAKVSLAVREDAWASSKAEARNPAAAQAGDPDFPQPGDRGDMGAMSPDLSEILDEAAGVQKTADQARVPKIDLSKDADVLVDAFGRRIQDPYGLMKHKVQTWFNQTYKAGRVHPIFSRWSNSMAMRASYLNNRLDTISKLARRSGDVDGSLTRAAFQNVQRGVTSANAASAAIEKEIADVLDDFFELSASGSMGNSFLRISDQVGLVNGMLDAKGLKATSGFTFDVDKATINGVFSPDALADQWRGWKVEDPLDFMHKLSLAREELAINAGTARSYVELAKSLGAWSDTPKAGFVKLTASGKSRFIGHLPKGTYIQKELAEELRHVESALRVSREFEGELGRFVRNVYAPLLNGWKRSITIMRPGHHVRNYIGSTSATWVRRGGRELARSHRDAYKILLQKNEYTGVDMLAAAERNGVTDLPQRGDVLFDLGSRGKLTVDEAYAYLADGGVFPSFKVGEDFLNAGGKLDKAVETVTLQNTKVGHAAAAVSEYTDHFTRTQHFMQALRQDAASYPKMSKAQLMERAKIETLKYHPDASMLTATEAKIRLAIPFYSWMAKIMPALIESMIMHPGRVSAIGRANYNVMVGMGLNPEGLTDQFPDDQLFPSFIKANPLGPQMKFGDTYVRMNPGFAHLDVLNTFGDDPWRGLLGMTTPFVRVPAELASGGSWSTGGRIADSSDYVDQSIPGINYVANLTGVSPTGSVGSLLSGQGLDTQAGYTPKADGSTDKDDGDKLLSAVNWLSGLGFQNLSRPSYTNYAEIEQRNAAGKEANGGK